MLGPGMFDCFVLPELAASCARLPGGAFYPLDGVGELPHTASLHAIPGLAGIQWVPGAPGACKPAIEWLDVQQRIRDDGKLFQTWGGPDELDALINAVGDASNTVVIGYGSIQDEARFRAVLKKHKIED
jgi:5-methyltetrahydrofolate--homocysteine methyltransferase